MKFLKNERSKVLFSVILGILGGLVGVSIFGLSGYMISLSFFNPPLVTIVFIIVVIKLFGMSKGIFKYLERLFSHDATFQMINRLRLTYFTNTLSYNTDTRDVRLIEKLNQYFDEVEDYYIRIIYPFLTSITIALVISLLGILIDYKVVLVFGLFSISVLIIIPLLLTKRSESLYNQQEALESDMYVRLYALIHNYTDLFITKQDATKRNDIKSLLNQKEQIEEQRDNTDAFFRIVAQLIEIILLVVIIVMMETNALLIPLVILVFINLVELLIPVMKPVSEYSHVKESLYNITDDTKEEIDSNNKLYVNHLTYRYKNTHRDVLKDVSLRVHPGEKHVIIGPSGSGKSTLLRQFVTKETSVMPQFLDFYNASLKDNLTMFGKNDVNESTLDDYLHYFDLKELKLEDTIYFTEHLSSGEQKRLHAIRMILENKPIWVMDEPTARLNDVLKENMWQLLLKRETLVVVTHDLSHLQDFDYIHYLADGEIVETLTKDALNNENTRVYEAIKQFNFMHEE